MARLTYKQRFLSSIHSHLSNQEIRDRLLSLWKDGGFISLNNLSGNRGISSGEERTQTEALQSLEDGTDTLEHPIHFVWTLDTPGSESLKFQEFEFFEMLIAVIPTIRYLAPRTPLPKSADFFTRLIWDLPDDRFM
jgi:hypothetical protein